MEHVVPCSALCQLIEPVYPKPGNGRPPVGVERMLRIRFLQQWFDLSDPAVEEARYHSRAMRNFFGIDLGRKPVPDETTVCRFRHLLEQHDFARLAVFRMPDVGQCSINGDVSSPAAAVSTPAQAGAGRAIQTRLTPRRVNGGGEIHGLHTPFLVRFTNCNYLITWRGRVLNARQLQGREFSHSFSARYRGTTPPHSRGSRTKSTRIRDTRQFEGKPI
jgi:hypothetical protein